MRQIERRGLSDYLKNDVIAQYIETFSDEADFDLTCQKWLQENPVKRYIFHDIYYDLLSSECRRKRILDVGGGLTCFSKHLASKHDYTLVDILAHDPIEAVERITRSVGYDFVVADDWYKFTPEVYDVVIVNDLFPNVDQRLALFLEKFVDICSEIRLLLTWYDNPRFYQTKRIDGDEIFYMLAWDSPQLLRILQGYENRIEGYDPGMFIDTAPSLYANGRQVCVVKVIGSLSNKIE